MPEAIYTRQENIKLNVPEVATVVGCGGGGYWTALMLAMAGTKQLILYDGDVVEIHNLNRLPYTVNDIGRIKSEILAEQIIKIRPEISIVSNKHLEEISPVLGVIFDCTDSIKAQELVKEKCREDNLFYIRTGSSEDHITIDDDKTKDEWVDVNQAPGYDIVPIWCGPAMLSAILGIMKVFTCQSSNIALFINELFEKLKFADGKAYNDALDIKLRDVVSLIKETNTEDNFINHLSSFVENNSFVYPAAIEIFSKIGLSLENTSIHRILLALFTLHTKEAEGELTSFRRELIKLNRE